jgi:lipopolysaccharide biosynthesis glycosyltransferase
MPEQKQPRIYSRGYLISKLTEKNVIHVVLAADGNYAMPLAVAMCSAAANCDRKRRLMFSVIQSGIERDLRAKIESSLEQTGFPDVRIDWLKAQTGRFADFKITHHYMTAMIYARLLIPELLPVEVEKALYLDCDLVVLDDLGELWDTDLGQKSLFAVRDLIAFVSAPAGLVNYRELGIHPEAKYFNSGVLLMNLKKWREYGTSEQVFRYLRTHREIIQMVDQEALNAVLFDDWGELDFRWNWQIPWRNYRLGKCKMPWVPESDRKSIVHFTTAEKPWLPGCDYEERKYFFEYLDRTEWAGWRVPRQKEVSTRLIRALRDAKKEVSTRLIRALRDAKAAVNQLFRGSRQNGNALTTEFCSDTLPPREVETDDKRGKV